MKKLSFFAILFVSLFVVSSCSALGDDSFDGNAVEESYWQYLSEEDGVKIDCCFQIHPVTKEDRENSPFEIKSDVNLFAQGALIYVEEIDESVNTSYVNDVYSTTFFTWGHKNGNKIAMSNDEDLDLSFEDGALVVDFAFTTNILHRKRHIHVKMKRITKAEWDRY
ncbi:MAG: hypothetical protein MJZ04_03300 [Bacteroidales bacterium]|nr:hypothetical protein [Bacteroidales bacterium]